MCILKDEKMKELRFAGLINFIDFLNLFLFVNTLTNFILPVPQWIPFLEQFLNIYKICFMFTQQTPTMSLEEVIRLVVGNPNQFLVLKVLV